jgi:hypothetical protein
MAIDTYAKLQSSISDILNREDLIADVTKYSGGTIEGVVKRAIRRTELRVQRDLRVRQMEASSAMTFTAGNIIYALPSDFMSARLLFITGTPRYVITQTTLDGIYAEFAADANQRPIKFAISGNNLHVQPTPDATYGATLFYYQEIPTLSDTNASNWLLEDAPDIYEYGSLMECTTYLRDDQRLQVWTQLYNEGIRLLNGDDSTARFTGVLQQPALPVQVVV